MMEKLGLRKEAYVKELPTSETFRQKVTRSAKKALSQLVVKAAEWLQDRNKAKVKISRSIDDETSRESIDEHLSDILFREGVRFPT